MDRRIFISCMFLIAIGLVLATRKRFSKVNQFEEPQMNSHNKKYDSSIEKYLRRRRSIIDVTAQFAGNKFYGRKLQMSNSDFNCHKEAQLPKTNDKQLYGDLADALKRLEGLSSLIAGLQEKFNALSKNQQKTLCPSQANDGFKDKIHQKDLIKIHNTAWIECLESGVCKLNNLMP